MRIVVYAPVFVRPTETFIYDATCGLVASGHEVHVVTAERDAGKREEFASLNVIPRPGGSDPRLLLRRALRPILGLPPDGERMFVHRRRLKSCIETIGPQVILANYGQGGALIAPVAAALEIPLVVSFHGADASRVARQPKWQKRYRHMFSKATLVTGPSAYVCDRLVSLGCSQEKTRVLHYGIRPGGESWQAPSERFSGDTIRFLFVGRMTAKKDPLTLLRSFAITREQITSADCRLTMIGDGPMRDEVEQLIKELKLDDAVTLHGHVPHREVLEQFRSAHIYVQHSVTAPNGDEEGLPVSITEAMAAGLPVVSTRHSGIPEAVHHETTGLLVDEGDVEGMAEAMTRLATDTDAWDRFGAAGKALLEREFAVPIVRENLQEILRSAAASKQSTSS